MKVLQINTSVNYGSTGRIAEDIGRLLLKEGHESQIAYGRSAGDSQSDLIKIGNHSDFFFHFLQTRVFDRHGFGSNIATKKFVNQLQVYKPDIIHLHNIHGYYLNIRVLFEYIKKVKTPVVWTFHDCWPFTGHCSYFDSVACYKWQTECFNCPNLKGYPKSWFIDNSKNNFYQKRELFTSIEKLTIVTPSMWLAKHVTNSFLNKFSIKIIHNGVDLKIFKPVSNKIIINKRYNIPNEKFVLGVANHWDKRKGLSDFLRLRELLSKEIDIVLVGLSEQQVKGLPTGIIGIKRTQNTEELAMLYSAASIYINPTYVDNFPTTNIEALACGTPVVTYETGGSPEAINGQTGAVIAKGDIDGLISSIQAILKNGPDYYTHLCRERADELFDKDFKFKEYLDLYESIVTNNQESRN